MINIHRTRCCAVSLGLMLCLGCGKKKELTLLSVQRPMTIAIAPAMNHSGSTAFDTLRISDLMASELTGFPGVKVLPLNRVLAQLEMDGKKQIESPAHALDLMDRLGADGIIVFAVTEYSPYQPPIVGIAAQLYGYGPETRQSFDPVAVSRQSAPFEAGAYPQWPLAEYQRVFNGADERVEDEIRHYARRRDADESPLGYRKFLVSQEHFWRFCSYVTVRELIRQEVTHVAAFRERQIEVVEHDEHETAIVGQR